MAERPHFVATAAGADDALARVRRRRRRSGAAVAGGGGVALSAVAAAFLVLAPADKDALRVDDTPVTDPAPAATVRPPGPTPTPEPEVTPSTAPSTVVTVGTSSAPVPRPGATPGTDPTAAPAPRPSAPPAPAPAPGRGTTLTRQVVPYTASTACDLTGEPGWCVEWTGVTSSRTGERAALGLQLCNLPDGRGGRAQFSDELEIDVRIYDGEPNPPEWGWYDDRPGTRGPAIDVADATCLRWRLDWDGLRTDGRPMAPGDYTRTYSVSADLGAVGGHTTYGASYTVSG